MAGSESLPALVFQARRLIAYTNREFAELQGVSIRTVIRHQREGGVASPFRYEPIIRAVYPKDRALAAKLAAATGHDLVTLGLEGQAPVPPKLRPEHADAVVYAAADALGLAPRQVRPAVLAAFARAGELGLDLRELAAAFAAERAPIS